MSLADKEIRQLELQVKQYIAGSYVDSPELADVKLYCQYSLQYLAHQLALTFRAPVMAVRDQDVIAAYPRGLWDYVKRALRLPYTKVVVKLTEHVLFPEILKTLTQDALKNPRVHIAYTSTLHDARVKDEA